MKCFPSFLVLALALGLTACEEDKPQAKKEETPAKQETSAPKKDSGGTVKPKQAADEKKAAAPQPQKSNKEAKAGKVTDTACLSAVAKQTGEKQVVVLSSEFSEANSLVMVGVGLNKAPWRCLVSNDGVVAKISSATDEGKL